MTTITLSLSRVFSRASDYLELAKARLVSLVLLSTAVGFFLASPGRMNMPLFWLTLAGTGLVAAGSMALNQWMERVHDARMPRTSDRPLPAGRLHAWEALISGCLVSVTGIFLLFSYAGPAAAFLAALTLVSYLLLYTPMKRTTSLCTIVGAVPGALPPLIGWAAVAGKPSFEAWILFAIMFLWQMPHFLAIAWMYRKEYAAADFRMLSVTDESGEQVGRQILIYSLALLPVSLLPAIVHLNGVLYFFSALALGLYLIKLAVESLKNLDQKARPLFRASILYLALILIMMVADKA